MPPRAYKVANSPLSPPRIQRGAIRQASRVRSLHLSPLDPATRRALASHEVYHANRQGRGRRRRSGSRSRARDWPDWVWRRLLCGDDQRRHVEAGGGASPGRGYARSVRVLLREGTSPGSADRSRRGELLRRGALRPDRGRIRRKGRTARASRAPCCGSSMTRKPVSRMRARSWTERAAAVVLVCPFFALSGCTQASVLRGRIAGLSLDVTNAEKNGAMRCAPRELALAKS